MRPPPDLPLFPYPPLFPPPPAHHDPLTQLPNRRKLAAHLASALARAGTRQRLALLFVDVDNFKSINDTLGHSFGDRVLQNIAERLHAATGAKEIGRAHV